MENETRLERWLDHAIAHAETPRGGAAVIATVTTIATIGAGLLMTAIDQKNFTTLGQGLWWAVQTVTTVGYGDHVPSTVAGQLVAALVMLLGLAFLAERRPILQAMAPKDDEQRAGLGDAAGRAAFFSARAAARAWRGPIERRSMRSFRRQRLPASSTARSQARCRRSSHARSSVTACSNASSPSLRKAASWSAS